MTKLLKDLYRDHSGKVSDKWSLYLDLYDEKLNNYRLLPIKLFEIGILNGGSLEIFAEYFTKAKLILGCDIDTKCEQLKYKNSNIKLIIGDANKQEIKDKITKYSKFDIIIDDGSHNSIDVVSSFSNYFNHLEEGGLYIIEDLHCSYWQEHGGGLFYPISSINFFKKLIDILNYEHWGVEKKKDWLLKGFSTNYKIEVSNIQFDQIHSIEFINSMCFITKKKSDYNVLGKRIITGVDATVVEDRKKLDNTKSETLNQSSNPWSNKNYLPEEELVLYQKEIEKIEKKNIELEEEKKILKKK